MLIDAKIKKILNLQHVTEKSYYDALETYLSMNTANRYLEIYHLSRVMYYWPMDHYMHNRVSYYPNNKYPIGSKMEFDNFTSRGWNLKQQWKLITHYYMERQENGDDVCPCEDLIDINVFDMTRTRNGRYKIEIENDLMFSKQINNSRSNPSKYVNLNRWLISLIRKCIYSCGLVNGRANVIYYDGKIFPVNFVPRSIFERKINGIPTRNRCATKTAVDKIKSDVYRLLYGDNCEIRSDDEDDLMTLTRLETNESRLLSERLVVDSCKHNGAYSVRFEQRRCGDEAATEIRTCLNCGRDRIIQ